MLLRRLLLVVIVLVCVSLKSYAQPSFTIDFHFRLYDSLGKAVEAEQIGSEYRLLDWRNEGWDIWFWEGKQYRIFRDTAGYYNGSDGVVYNDLVRKLVHGADTMTLILQNDMHGGTYRIDSLYIKPGTYLITDEKLYTIDFKKATTDYYNYLLQIIRHHSNPLYVYYSENKIVSEFNQLRAKYGISPDDYVPKTKEELVR